MQAQVAYKGIVISGERWLSRGHFWEQERATDCKPFVAMVIHVGKKVAQLFPIVRRRVAHEAALANYGVLSSRLVKRVKWAENVPTSILGKEYDSANKACCALRTALDSSKESLGNNGINFKVFLCVNTEGKAVTVKEVLEKKQLGKYLK
jgi:hypothetical protein